MNNDSSHHIIRDVPASTWREFKAEAAREGLRLGEFLKLLVEAWKEKEGKNA